MGYPAILRPMETKSFSHPEEAASFLKSHLHTSQELTLMETNRYPEGPWGATQPLQGSI